MTQAPRAGARGGLESIPTNGRAGADLSGGPISGIRPSRKGSSSRTPVSRRSRGPSFHLWPVGTVRLDQRYVTLDGYSRTWVRPLISRTSFPSASGVPAPVASLYAADATHLDIAAGRPKQGRDRIALGLASFFSGFPARWTVSAS